MARTRLGVGGPSSDYQGFTAKGLGLPHEPGRRLTRLGLGGSFAAYPSFAAKAIDPNSISTAYYLITLGIGTPGDITHTVLFGLDTNPIVLHVANASVREMPQRNRIREMPERNRIQIA